ncbi:Os07g0694200, partial [Oryza sativa Japonica Group]
RSPPDFLRFFSVPSISASLPPASSSTSSHPSELLPFHLPSVDANAGGAAANLAHAPPPPVPNLARAVGAPPGKRIEVVWERENTLLSFGQAAAHAAVAFVEFNVQFTGWRQNAA